MVNILNKSIEEWIIKFPLIKNAIDLKEVLWINESKKSFDIAKKGIPLEYRDILDANERLKRFSSYIAEAFPETKEDKGIIESETLEIEKMKYEMEKLYMGKISGRILMKCDNFLPISGSIKARGGIYEVLKYAEKIALENNMISYEENYSIICEERFKKLYSKYAIAVGSTGNLGLSIGIISSKLGFNVTVHMSADAKEWKKNLLREKGVTVIEYEDDYSKAVTEGRKQALKDPNCHFVDDENSKDLFLGYAVSALRLKQQLDNMNIKIDEENRLFVYLPCGVGGGPGGVTFGLKMVFGDNVHCFFAEPTHSPCMFLGMYTGEHNNISVQDFGIDNITEADGLAVGRASEFVGKSLEYTLDGIYTIQDEELYKLLKLMVDSENIKLEPSALAGIKGPFLIENSDIGKKYLNKFNIDEEKIVHLCWATGGNMVPSKEMDSYYEKSKNFIK